MNKINSMKLSEPWYTLIKNGKKTVEGRIYDKKRKLLNVGDTLIFTDTNGKNEIVTTIINLKVFKNFDKAIRYAKLKNVLPNIRTYKDGVKIYHSIPGYKKKEKKYGVVLIFFKMKKK